MNKQITLCSGFGINWSWYLTLEIPTKAQCRIIKHWQLPKIHGCTHPKTIGSYYLIEDAKPLKNGWHSRNAIAVRVWREGMNDGENGKRLKVLNPGYIFGYDGHTAQPPMMG